MITNFNVLRLVVIVGLLFVLPGCFSANKEDLSAFTRPDMANVSMDHYIIQPPDTLTIIASNIPELEGAGTQVGQSQVVRPDGMISFENIGEISVAGKTPRQVAEILSETLMDMYKLIGDYPVDVRINNASKLYFILGMVRNPGAKVFSGRETTLAAVSRAVPNSLAWRSKIQVIRPSLDPSIPSKIFCMDFKAMTVHGKMQGDVLLQEGDIIYVPPTILASIGLTVHELVSPILSGGSAARMLESP